MDQLVRHANLCFPRESDAAQFRDVLEGIKTLVDTGKMTTDRALELVRLAIEQAQHAHFAGLTLEEAAAALNVHVRTAQRHWIYAKAWLMEEQRGYSGG